MIHRNGKARSILASGVAEFRVLKMSAAFQNASLSALLSSVLESFSSGPSSKMITSNSRLSFYQPSKPGRERSFFPKNSSQSPTASSRLSTLGSHTHSGLAPIREDVNPRARGQPCVTHSNYSGKGGLPTENPGELLLPAEEEVGARQPVLSVGGQVEGCG